MSVLCCHNELLSVLFFSAHALVQETISFLQMAEAFLFADEYTFFFRLLCFLAVW